MTRACDVRTVTAAFGAHGTVEEWRERVGVLCGGNSRLVVAVSAALCGPLLVPAGLESFGIHWYGASATGKTMLLRVASSVWGSPTESEPLQTGRATAAEIKAVASARSGTFLPLGNLDGLDPIAAASVASSLRAALASEQGPHRVALTFQSTSERSLYVCERAAGPCQPPGNKVQWIDVPAEVEGGHGCFTNLHGGPDGAAFVGRIGSAAREVFGVIGPAFVDAIAAHRDRDGIGASWASEAFVRRHVRPGTSELGWRVALNLGMAAFAGELATELGLTGRRAGDANAGAVEVLADWMAAHGRGDLPPLKSQRFAERGHA